MNLQKFKAKVCYTAAGILIYKSKVLLIKHKKLQIWFCPGGHIDLENDELPHQAAEREFWEETGIKVKAVDYLYRHDSKISEYVPSPIETNLHWVSQDNYQKRLASKNPDRRYFKNLVWSKGCEQHLGFLYMVRPIAGVDFKQNVEETDGIGWFSLAQMNDLKTNDDIRSEIKHAFELNKQAEKAR
jgi:8-oxo-dGTP pyrophosphatase MutT (NUDIX family)